MVYILGAQRESHAAVAEGFTRYRQYLAQHSEHFPPGAFALATSAWYYDPLDHRCPHDAWLESAAIEEPAAGSRREVRSTMLRVRLLGAYQDGHIELRYPNVVRYELAQGDGSRGHGDWRYDEFRISDDGRLVHEIEWARATGSARWTIEAEDVEFSWQPDSATHSPPMP